MNQGLKLKNIGMIIIILIIGFFIILGISFIHRQNVQYQQSNKEIVVEEEIETKIPEVQQIEKEPIKPPGQEEYEEKDFNRDTIMIF